MTSYPLHVVPQLRNQLTEASRSQEGEVRELHRSLAEQKSRSRDRENSLRDEISSLKSSVKELNQKFGKTKVLFAIQLSPLIIAVNVDLSGNPGYLKAKVELAEVRSQMEELKQQKKKGETELSEAREQVPD